ncbi:hypothetical protein [Enterobacter hormaechei]|uniref:hypothetical protein n=1 Tax=Enterobacter hormaechei TaxID=158836 RepID=UPI0007924230|nr:hypothetical protein [Enterobacter hormaechei]MCM7600809.1 ead/Ea22-like family protein [Enterobacter hormaechei]SAG97388.1 Uncharacterised protein [Enterobacter hormaechei]HAS0739578.1 ead/Ea22-like family protein [Enterobacter hormaechei subsp. oharae]HAT7676375.1 ead/Ea22-like family protein [Enterobacter hormaechei subsp. oharae]
MSNINKQDLRLTAEKAKDNFMPNFMVPTRDLLALLDELEAAEKLIAELETREVILPQRMDPEGYHIDEAYMVAAEDGEYLDRDEVIEAMRTAGIRINGEG